MAEDVEKRFERAMDCLFPGSSSRGAAAAATSLEFMASSPVKGSNEKQQQQLVGVHVPPQAIGTVVPPTLASPPACRPWDRRDLLRRLATYKSMSWFGKPQAAGPVACASRGWVLVDVDLICCEICGSYLSFPVPPCWSQYQVESAAQVFAEQLDTAHKGLCAWKNNSCPDTLAQFPPAPLSAVLGAYTDRCEALLQLSALPVISESAINQMLNRGSQVDQLLSQPTDSMPRLLIQHNPGSSTSEEVLLNRNYKAFYQAQHAIAICGWDSRLLPYTVDCGEQSAVPSTKNNGCTVTENTGISHEPGPIVMIHSRGKPQQVCGHNQVQRLHSAASDPASVVLDCNLCGASVGLWRFTTIAHPSPLRVPGMAQMPEPAVKYTETGMTGASAASCMDGWTQPGPEPEMAKEPHVKAAEAVTVTVSQKSQKGVLDLSLTIAGGPPPTQLTAPALVPPSFGPVASMQPHQGQAETSDTGEWAAHSYESHGPAQRELETGGQGGSNVDIGQHGRPLAADSVEGTVVDHQETEDEEGKDAEHSSKRKRSTATVETEQADVSYYLHGGKHKYKEWPCQELLHTSSVNAIATHYLQKQENSMESVENLPQESDGQGATTGEDQKDGPETVVVAEHSRSQQDAAEARLSKSDEEGGGGAETNIGVISRGVATAGEASVRIEGGGGTVGMWTSHEAETQGAECTKSVGGDGEFMLDMAGLMDEFVPGCDLMSEFIPEGTDRTGTRDDCGDSQEIMLSMNHVFKRDNGSARESEASQEGKGSRMDNDGRMDAEETLDTRNAVVQGSEMDANMLDKELMDGRVVQTIADTKNEEVQSPAHNDMVLQLEWRNWEIKTREFDPIQQHRHFCPWVNGHVAAAGSSSALCGWQVTLNALQQQQHSPAADLAESESTASMYKVDPLLSMRNLLGQRSTNKQGLGSHIQS